MQAADTETKEVIVLVGGAGTRLQSISGSTPKCMMPVNGHPFVVHVVKHLLACGFQRFVFALHENQYQLRHFLEHYEKDCRQQYAGVAFCFSTETTSLGTGGAIMQALQHCTAAHVLVVNGDSILLANPMAALKIHMQHNALCTLHAVYRQQADRYGLVHFNPQHALLHFSEKQANSEGYINAGMYWVNSNALQNISLPTTFSWEQSFLQASGHQSEICVYPAAAYFIDIGIPEDYEKAQTELAQAHPLRPGKGWTLFLDRDGVINIEKENDYIHHWDEFHFYEDAISSITALSKLFDRIIIVTNQKGVGKGLTLPENLQHIHEQMLQAINAGGGHIDAIYFCPDLDNNSPNRKPNAGMAYQAKHDFPLLHFHQSVIVGNNLSDLYFGRNAGMHTVFLRTTQPDAVLPHALADMEISHLNDLVKVWLPHDAC